MVSRPCGHIVSSLWCGKHIASLCDSYSNNRPAESLLPHPLLHIPHRLLSNEQQRAGQATSSSGLHHDYHDNLYVLLRGQKRFRLWSPDSAQRMYTRGALARVHSNGRINYVGQVRG
jgi:Cupin-like domain